MTAENPFKAEIEMLREKSARDDARPGGDQVRNPRDARQDEGKTEGAVMIESDLRYRGEVLKRLHKALRANEPMTPSMEAASAEAMLLVTATTFLKSKMIPFTAANVESCTDRLLAVLDEWADELTEIN